MAKKITFNNGTAEINLTVQSCFPYQYTTKTVLKLLINESDHTFAEIKELKNNVGDIIYSEDDVVKSEYSGFDFPDKGFLCRYTDTDGTFDIEITQKGDLDERVSAVEEAVEAIMIMLAGE